MDIGFLFLVALPSRSAFIAAGALLAKSRHVTFDAAVLERGHILPMARVSVRTPRCEGRKIGYFFERFAGPAERFGKGPKINPFEVRLL